MDIAKLSSKSQITVPRKVRQELRIGKGDRIGFEATEDGRFIISKATPIRKSDGAARRRLGNQITPMPDLEEVLVRAMREDDQRIRTGR